MTFNNWRTLKRKVIYNSKFLKVYENIIKLPSGEIINNYTTVQKPDYVMVVATDTNNNLISIEEFKYAADQKLLTLPAGHLKQGESAIDRARLELLQETGYTSNNFNKIGKLYEYPSKDLHTITLVRVKNAKSVRKVNHEPTESIKVKLIPLQDLKKILKKGKFKVSSSIAALTLSGLLS